MIVFFFWWKADWGANFSLPCSNGSSLCSKCSRWLSNFSRFSFQFFKLANTFDVLGPVTGPLEVVVEALIYMLWNGFCMVRVGEELPDGLTRGVRSLWWSVMVKWPPIPPKIEKNKFVLKCILGHFQCFEPMFFLVENRPIRTPRCYKIRQIGRISARKTWFQQEFWLILTNNC